MPKKQNQKLKQKNRKFVKREEKMLASFEAWTMPKKPEKTYPAPEVSPAVMGTLKTIKKSNNKKKIRNKKRREAAVERALAKGDLLEQKLSNIEKKQDGKAKAKAAW